jgi:hypothetical protein
MAWAVAAITTIIATAIVVLAMIVMAPAEPGPRAATTVVVVITGECRG